MSCRGTSKPSLPLLLLLVLLGAPGDGAAQLSVRVDVEENFRREPQGQVLGRLSRGTTLSVRAREGAWTEAALDGWVWTASLRTTDREGFDLVVAAEGGENLRAEPSGIVLARLEEGTLLEELERRPGWTRVRRVGWVWSESVETVEERAASGPSGTVDGPAGAEGDAAQAERFLELGDRAAILGSPDGDTLAHAVAGSDVQLLAREGSWVRVRLEGWTWMPSAASGDEEGTEDPVPATITPEMLSGADGASYEGRRVSWSVQFISLERAEAVRTDFFEGEPFILGRFGGADGPFVYVAVPPERLQTAEGLTPLEMIRVTGRVRRAASALTGTPIVDLLALERGRGP